MCTKLDYFCDKCCRFQFGYDQLKDILDCTSQCDAQVTPLIEKHSVFHVPVTNLLQRGPRRELEAKLASQQVIHRRRK